MIYSDQLDVTLIIAVPLTLILNKYLLMYWNNFVPLQNNQTPFSPLQKNKFSYEENDNITLTLSLNFIKMPKMTPFLLSSIFGDI